MKRIIKKEIDNCFDCPLCELLDGFSCHRYQCNHYGIVAEDICCYKSSERAERQLQEWFKNCQVWAESQEIDSPAAQERKAKP